MLKQFLQKERHKNCVKRLKKCKRQHPGSVKDYLKVVLDQLERF